MYAIDFFKIVFDFKRWEDAHYACSHICAASVAIEQISFWILSDIQDDNLYNVANFELNLASTLDRNMIDNDDSVHRIVAEEVVLYVDRYEPCVGIRFNRLHVFVDQTANVGRVSANNEIGLSQGEIIC